VSSSNSNFEAIAKQDQALREAPTSSPRSWDRRSRRSGRPPAISGLRCGRRGRSCASRRRSSATRSARSPATPASRCASCAAPRCRWARPRRASRGRSRS
jgi:hypothetical protein